MADSPERDAPAEEVPGDDAGPEEEEKDELLDDLADEPADAAAAAGDGDDAGGSGGDGPTAAAARPPVKKRHATVLDDEDEEEDELLEEEGDARGFLSEAAVKGGDAEGAADAAEDAELKAKERALEAAGGAGYEEDDVIVRDEDAEPDAGDDAASEDSEDFEKDQELDEEDYELLQENQVTGFKRPAKPAQGQRKRLRKAGDGDAKGKQPVDDAEALEADLFGDDDSGDEGEPLRKREEEEDLFDDDEDEMADFIADDDEELGPDGLPIKRKKKRRPKGTGRFNAVQLQEATDIFGDADNMLDMYAQARAKQREGEAARDEDEMEEDEAPTQRKQMDTVEPAIRDQHFLGELDQKIARKDLPERVQERIQSSALEKERFRVRPRESDLVKEAAWIYDSIFGPTAPEYRVHFRIGQAGPSFGPDDLQQGDVEEGRRKELVTKHIVKVLKLLLEERLEVPAIAMWHKAECGPLLDMDAPRTAAQLEFEAHKYSQMLAESDDVPEDYRAGSLARWRALHRVQEMDKRWGIVQARKSKQMEVMEGFAEAAKSAATLSGRPMSTMDEVKAMAAGERIKGVFSFASSPEEVDDAEALAGVVLADWGVSFADLTRAAGRSSVISSLRPIASTAYERQVKAGLVPLAEKLFPSELIAEDYAKGERSIDREIEDPEDSPEQVAQELCGGAGGILTSTALDGARLVAAQRLVAHTGLRKKVRAIFFSGAEITTTPTEKGDKGISHYHRLAPVKWLRSKPAHLLMQWDDRASTDFGSFVIDRAKQQHDMDGSAKVSIPLPAGALLIEEGVKAGLLEVKVELNKSALEALRADLKAIGAYLSDGESAVAQAWNDEREKAVALAVDMLLKSFERELRQRMLQISRDFVASEIGEKFWGLVSAAPAHSYCENAGDPTLPTTYHRDIRVMAVIAGDSSEDPVVCVICDTTGELAEIVTLPALAYEVRRFEEPNKHFKTANESVMLGKWRTDFNRCLEFMRQSRPNVVVVGSASRYAKNVKTVMAEVHQKLVELHPRDAMEHLDVQYADQRMATLLAQGKAMLTELPDQAEKVRVAVSLCRSVQDPMAAGAALVAEKDVAALLRLHALQDQLSKEDRLEVLTQCMVSLVNQVGVDLNITIAHPWRTGCLQFVGGLGPRKARKLLDLVRAHGPLLKRIQLLTSSTNDSKMQCMGDKVFSNACSGLRIDRRHVDDHRHSYEETDIIDDTRNSQVYADMVGEIAQDAVLAKRKRETEGEDQEPPMRPAVEDALKTFLDVESAEDHWIGDRRAALRELWALDLNSEAAFMRYAKVAPKETYEEWSAENIEVAGQSYDDRHLEYMQSCAGWDSEYEAFKARAADIRAELTWPYGEVRPVYMWPGSSPYEVFKLLLGDEWEHFRYGRVIKATIKYVGDAQVRLDVGHPSIDCWCRKEDYLSAHDQIESLTQVAKKGEPVDVRVLNPPDYERFSVQVGKRSGLLADKLMDKDERSGLAHYFDMHWEVDALLRKKREDAKRKTVKSYIPRRVDHPYFKNCTRSEAVEALSSKRVGEFVLRPSSKGTNHLSLTYKVCPDVFADMDIKEGNKKDDVVGSQTANHLVLGRPLTVDGQNYDDLDELFVHHVDPVVQHIKNAISYRKFIKLTSKHAVDDALRKQKEKNPAITPYFFALPGGDRSGLLMLASILGTTSPIHEYLQITPRGYKFRSRERATLDDVVKEFKRSPEPPRQEQRQEPAAAPMADVGGNYGNAGGDYGNYGNYDSYGQPMAPPPEHNAYANYAPEPQYGYGQQQAPPPPPMPQHAYETGGYDAPNYPAY
eukprot:PRCOL_00004004-RA